MNVADSEKSGRNLNLKLIDYDEDRSDEDEIVGGKVSERRVNIIRKLPDPSSYCGDGTLDDTAQSVLGCLSDRYLIWHRTASIFPVFARLLC